MAAPINSSKRTVDLAPGAGAVRVSRIRRDPPPVAKKVNPRERRERDQRTLVIGVLSFAAAIAIVIVSFSDYLSWHPSQVQING